jgi:hypothetical protein
MRIFHSATSAVHHDHPRCPVGLLVAPGSRLEGSGGKPRCVVCEQIAEMDAESGGRASE